LLIHAFLPNFPTNLFSVFLCKTFLSCILFINVASRMIDEYVTSKIPWNIFQGIYLGM
jgi:hypothetical protein